MNSKIKEFFKLCKVNSVLLRNFSQIHDPNFYYFSKLYGDYSNSFLILKKNKKPLLMGSVLEYGNFKKSSAFRIQKIGSEKQLVSVLRKELSGKVGFNAEVYPKKSFQKLKRVLKRKKLVDVSEKLFKIRAVKTKKEIEKIKKAVKVSEKTISKIDEFFNKKTTEKQLANKIEFELKNNGADNIAFPTIVASGRRGKTPHYIPSNKKISKGFLLIDFGAKYKNYCSDLSRTFFVGRASKKEKELYEKVFEAKRIAEQEINEGTVAFNVFKKVNSFLEKETGKPLIHGLGHGLGVEVHDPPTGFKKDSKTKLLKNMVFTVEPAIYGSFGGIRIEDNVVVEKKKCRNLSKAPRELIEL